MAREPLIAVAVLPPRETLQAISRTLCWHGPKGLWHEWLITLPSEVATELLTAEATPADGAKAQALAAAGLRAEPPRPAPALPMASWFPRRRCA